MYLARMCLAGGVFAAAAIVWADATPSTTFAATLILVLAGAVTVPSFWYTHVGRRAPGENFLYGQVVFDVLLVSAVVHLTGSSQSTFAPLYILVICAAAILLPILGGILIGLLASIVYVALIVFAAPSHLSGGVLLQVVLFALVALVIGALGDRLRQTGAELGEVETELRLLRLDTGDILASIHTGIITVDGAGRLAYINPAAAELLGLEARRWLGRAILEELDRLAPGLGATIARSAELRKPIFRSETDGVDGAFVLGVSTTLMERPTPERPPVTAIFQDITEKKRMETLRRRAERLEAVAELSASLAHEIRNPLASIHSAVEQLAGEDIDAHDRSVLGSLVVRESDRLSRLLTEFIDFARVKLTRPEPVALSSIVRDVELLVRAHPDAEGRSIAVRLGAEPEALRVQGAPDLLHRAVLNLVLNATQWAGAGGRVEIGLGTSYSDILSPALGVSEVVQLTVSDTGPGVPAEVSEQIFDPFFTLRPGGTGLGLALVQRAAEAHGGAVFVVNGRSPEASGATFTLYLPALAAGALAADPTPVHG